MSYDSWLEKPYRDAEHDCPDPENCTCEEDAEDAHEQHLIDQEEARRDAVLDDGPGDRWEP